MSLDRRERERRHMPPVWYGRRVVEKKPVWFYEKPKSRMKLTTAFLIGLLLVSVWMML